MTTPDLLGLFLTPLNALDVPYMVTGAVAAVVYGEPRFTRDVDIVLALPASERVAFAGAFPPAEFYVPPLEVIADELARPRGGHFNLIHLATSLKADIYPVGDDPLSAWGMERRVRHELGGTAIWLAPLEYVVLRKLEWYRDGGGTRHLDDLRAMLRVSGDALDRSMLDGWIARLGLQAQWEAVG